MDGSESAWKKVLECHESFKKIIAPLKEFIKVDFGHMIVFNGGRYFQIIEDLECLYKWVKHVETSHIFCSRNVTTYFDEPYNFTIWPKEPTCAAMKIYKEYDIWNGITISKTNKDYTKLYWFTKKNAEDGWHKWFIRNKLFLADFIKYFENNKIFEDEYFSKIQGELFEFKEKFNFSIPISDYQLEEKKIIFNLQNNLKQQIKSPSKELNNLGFLSSRETEVLLLIGKGYSAKVVSQRLFISQRTVRFHIEQIKRKLGLHYKTEIIQLFEKESL